MKEIKAYISKHKLDSVIRALHKIKALTGISVIDCSGYGRGLVKAEDPLLGLHPGIKIEIVCNEDIVEKVIESIEKAAHTGLKSDGKIYVSNIEQAIRISTGERGEGAI